MPASRTIASSAMARLPLISMVDPDEVESVVPLLKVSVPLVKLSDVSERRKDAPSTPSTVSASKVEPVPSLPEVQIVPPVVKVYV